MLFRSEKIKNVFLAILRDIKKDIDNGEQPGEAVTAAMFQAMRLCGGPDNSGVFRRWHAPRNFGTFCPEVRLLAVLPQPGYSFSDGHSVFKVLSIDELP